MFSIYSCLGAYLRMPGLFDEQILLMMWKQQRKGCRVDVPMIAVAVYIFFTHIRFQGIVLEILKWCSCQAIAIIIHV